MWLVRRVIVLGLFLVVLCAGVVLVVRGNATPSRLQVLGFDVCDGEPCWRGIKPGMDWDKTESYRLEKRRTRPDGPGLVVDDPTGHFVEITFAISPDKPIIATIYVRQVPDHPQPITAGEIVAHYGPPCSALNYGTVFYMIYPTMTAEVEVAYPPPSGVYVSPDTPVMDFYLGVTPPDRCLSRARLGSWHGFASYSVFQPRQP